jgi:hypothetical protein
MEAMGRFDKVKGVWITEPRNKYNPLTGFVYSTDDDEPPESLIKSLSIPAEFSAELMKIKELEIYEEIPFDFLGYKGKSVTKDKFIDEVKLKIEDTSGKYQHFFNLNGISGTATAYEICKTLNLLISENGKIYRKKIMKIANLDTLCEGKEARIVRLEAENREMRAELAKMKAALADTLDLLQSVAHSR